MNNLAEACDHLDNADARLAMISDFIGGTCGDLSMTESGMIGLCAVLRDIVGHIGSARAIVDGFRGQPSPRA